MRYGSGSNNPSSMLQLERASEREVRSWTAIREESIEAMFLSTNRRISSASFISARLNFLGSGSRDVGQRSSTTLVEVTLHESRNCEIAFCAWLRKGLPSILLAAFHVRPGLDLGLDLSHSCSHRKHKVLARYSEPYRLAKSRRSSSCLAPKWKNTSRFWRVATATFEIAEFR